MKLKIKSYISIVYLKNIKKCIYLINHVLNISIFPLINVVITIMISQQNFKYNLHNRVPDEFRNVSSEHLDRIYGTAQEDEVIPEDSSIQQVC